MKQHTLLLLLIRQHFTYGLLITFCIFFTAKAYADVTLTTSPSAAANIAQGTGSNIVYILKMDVTDLPVTVNSMMFTLTGTHDNNDLTTVTTWFNATAPSLTGASAIQNLSGLFAAPHTYNSTFNRTIAAGASGYFIITMNTAAAATNGNTIKLDGAMDPIIFGFTTSPTVLNNQTDVAGLQTILAAGTTLTTSPVASFNVPQGTSFDIVYIVKMDVTDFSVTVSNMQFTLSGTNDNNDLITITTWFNPTAPSLTGASAQENLSGFFAAPHTYNSVFSKTIAPGASGYFIITATIAATATNGNTFKINGAANPVIFGFTTSPFITNNQTDDAGLQIILAADVALSTSPIAASNIAQGTVSNIVYIVKMDVTSLSVTVNSMQFTLTGTHDNNDLTIITTWFNPTTPSLTGASGLENLSGLFAAPHTYTSVFSKTIASGASGYFIITVNAAAAATNGNTVKSDGAANPVTFGFTTSPTITNNQTDAAGLKTIQAAGITLTTSPVASSNIAQGTNNNIVYIVKMDVTTLTVTVTSMQFTLTGTHDNNDLTTITTWFNPTSPSLAGASGLENLSGLFAAPHTYNSFFSKTISAGASGYFIVSVNTAAAATSGNTIKLDGAANPVIFGFTTSPTITNNQIDAAGLQTILAAGVTVTTLPVAASNIAQGTTFNIVYIVKMDVTTLSVIVNSMQFTLTGTYDNNDLPIITTWFNPASPSLTGASGLENLSGLFAAPHTYNSVFSRTIASGASGYFIITVNTATAATNGNTVKLDGAANPAIFGFTTSPPVTNNQTDMAGVQTITGPLSLTLLSFTGSLINPHQVELEWKTTGELNTEAFDVECSDQWLHFNKVESLPAAGNSTQNLDYTYIHKVPVEGNNYYRLKMIDLDGQFTYSPIIKIYNAFMESKISAFPNPVSDILELDIQAIEIESLVFKLYDEEGKYIESKSISSGKGINRLSWTFQTFAKGNYFICTDNPNFETIKIIKN
ncbi:MAG: T9SS type A sorting domain-containing protein [Saprospiraceae bacterium]